MALAIIATFAIAITSTKRDPTLMVEAELRNHPIINPNARDSTASLIVQESPVVEEEPIAPKAEPVPEPKPSESVVVPDSAAPKAEPVKPAVVEEPKATVSSSSAIFEHTIASGENLSTLSRRYHVLIAKLREANGMKNDVMQAGKKLKVPVTATHTVANGETISQIAQKYSVGADLIKKANKLNSDGLQPGIQLIVPLP